MNCVHPVAIASKKKGEKGRQRAAAAMSGEHRF